jgi:hypothetical protein
MNSVPRPEHPTPNQQRATWLNLNGPWRFAFDPRLVGEQQRWHQPRTMTKNLTITVPYPWESPLSGVERTDYRGAAWYEREFTIPAEWQGLIPFLHFGAVDWSARVWINGRLAGEQDNGYLPFSIELSRFIQPGESATVTVRAFDIADASTLVGKQAPHWYTYSSGIWQTVWLEGRAPSHIRTIRIEPEVEQARAIVKLTTQIATRGEYRVRLRSPENAFPESVSYYILATGEQSLRLNLPLPEPKLWSPETPHLYDLVVELEPLAGGLADCVQSYFGLRSIARGKWDGKVYEYILLNGEPVYLRGALDQAFHPASLHAYPTDEVIRGDIQLAKELGLNMLRCHIKINDPRYYYWADKLGMLMMYDFPSPDLDTPTMRRIFSETLPRAITRDFNSPSIFAWVLFNETWGLTEHQTADGQHWLKEMVQLARQLDPTRLIEDNSVCRYDHVESDINSWHYYLNDYGRVRQHIQRVVDETFPGSSFNYVGGDYVQGVAPLMNSEYGGIAARMGDQDIAWCFKYQTNELRRHAKICGYVYTELDDIEWEHNGFVNYDRSRKEFGYGFFVPGMTVADLNQADFVGVDAPPCQSVQPGSVVRFPLFVSHWGAPLTGGQVRWQLDFIDRFGERRQEAGGHLPVQPRRFDVTTLEPLEWIMPHENGLATLALWLLDEMGAPRCCNYVHVEVRGEPSPRVEQLATGWVLRFAPGHFQRSSYAWPTPLVEASGAKFAAQGAGWVEYEVQLPPSVRSETIRSLRLLFEASARGGQAKVDWPQQTYGFNYPQTERDRQFPSDVTVLINEVVIAQVRLPDDPADARGVLSHYRGLDPGSYGYRTEIVVEGEDLPQVLAAAPMLRIRFSVLAEAAAPGGFALYGETVGGYPLDPTVVVEIGASGQKSVDRDQ